MIKMLVTTICDFFKLFIIYIPGRTGRKIRSLYYKKRFKRCGKNLMVDEGVIIENPQWISVGDNVWIDKYSILTAGPMSLEGLIYKERENKDFIYEEGEMVLGDNVHIAPFCILQSHKGISIGSNGGLSSGVKIYSITNISNKPGDRKAIVCTTAIHKDSAYCSGAIVLGENVGVALHSILLSGVSIGKNSFIIPMSMVTTSFPENSYIGGSPAVKIRDRFA